MTSASLYETGCLITPYLITLFCYVISDAPTPHMMSGGEAYMERISPSQSQPEDEWARRRSRGSGSGSNPRRFSFGIIQDEGSPPSKSPAEEGRGGIVHGGGHSGSGPTSNNPFTFTTSPSEDNRLIGVKDKCAAKKNDKVLAKRLEEARQLGKPKTGPLFEFDLWNKDKKMDADQSTVVLSNNYNSQTPTGSDSTAVYAYPQLQQPPTPPQQPYHHRWDLSPSSPDSSATITFRQLEDAVYGSSGDSSNYDRVRTDSGHERPRERESGYEQRSRGRKSGDYVPMNTEREGRSKTRHKGGLSASRVDVEAEMEGGSKRSGRSMGSFDGGVSLKSIAPAGPPRLSRAESEIVYGPSSRRKAMGAGRQNGSSHRRRSTPGTTGGDRDGHGGDKLTGFAALFGASSHRRMSPERGSDRARSLSPTWHQTNRREDPSPCKNQGKSQGKNHVGSVVSFAEGPPR